MRYIVTGVDGKLGGRVAENMLQDIEGKDLIFTCPNLSYLPDEKKERWEKLGVRLREANYDDTVGMTRAFEGGDRIWVVSAVAIGEKRVQQHKNVIDAAKAAGVQHITYTSCIGASDPDPKYASVFVLPDHTVTEEYLRASGVNYNIMRNNLYMENFLTTSVMLALMSNNKWYTTAGEGKATFIAKDDSARAASTLLLGKGEPNTAYNITGGESITLRDICNTISELSGINIEYCPVEAPEFFEYLDKMNIPREPDQDFSKSPVPWCGHDMVTNEAGIKAGLSDYPSDDYKKLTGREPLTIMEIAKKYSYIWEKDIKNWRDII